MTKAEIINSDKEYLIPADVAQILGTKAYSINCQAHENPAALGFPVIVIRSRVKIPREPFVRFMGWGV